MGLDAYLDTEMHTSPSKGMAIPRDHVHLPGYLCRYMIASGG